MGQAIAATAASGTTKILKSDGVDALDQARQGIAAAQAEAERIIASAHEERERVLAEAVEQGKQERAALVAEYVERMKQDFARRESAMVDVVTRSIRRLVEPVPEATLILALVRRAMRDVDIGADARLTVAPQHVHSVREQLEKNGISSGLISVQGNPDCPDGASTLHCAFGDIELGLDAQLGALEAGLRAASEEHAR